MNEFIKDKYVVGIVAQNLSPHIVVYWAKKYEGRLMCPEYSDTIEIYDVTYFEFLEIYNEYDRNLTNKNAVGILFKYSKNKLISQLNKPRIEILIYSR